MSGNCECIMADTRRASFFPGHGSCRRRHPHHEVGWQMRRMGCIGAVKVNGMVFPHPVLLAQHLEAQIHHPQRSFVDFFDPFEVAKLVNMALNSTSIIVLLYLVLAAVTAHQRKLPSPRQLADPATL